MSQLILETERLKLRYQNKSDIEFLVTLWSDQNMTQFIGGPRDVDYLKEEFTKVADNPQKEEYDLWPVELKENNKIVGYAGFIPKMINGQNYIELNYYIAHENQKKGYAIEIGKKLIEFGFTIKKVQQIIAIIDPMNTASINVATRLGMTFWKEEVRDNKIKKIYRIINIKK